MYGEKLTKKKVTLSMDDSVYDSYRDYCEENAILLSKKIELFMKQELENNSETQAKRGESK